MCVSTESLGDDAKTHLANLLAERSASSAPSLLSLSLASLLLQRRMQSKSAEKSSVRWWDATVMIHLIMSSVPQVSYRWAACPAAGANADVFLTDSELPHQMLQMRHI